MKRKRQLKSQKPSPVYPPDSLRGMAEQMCQYLDTLNYSEWTVAKIRQRLALFFAWCDERSIESPHEITRPMIERYQRYLYRYRKKNDKPLTSRTQFGYLTAVRRYFSYLARNNLILANPAADIIMPRIGQPLPKDTFNTSEVEQILSQPDISDPVGLRDRTILEVFYSCGLRRMEVVNLDVYDIDFERGVVIVREGKGRKDRVVPIGQRALTWLDKYLTEGRQQLLCGRADPMVLFLTVYGERFCLDHMTEMAAMYIERAQIGKKGACHLFRHTMATLMHENGADIRIIQEILGHVSINTTQIYTKVSIPHLKRVHDLTHPTNRPPPGREEAIDNDSIPTKV